MWGKNTISIVLHEEVFLGKMSSLFSKELFWFLSVLNGNTAILWSISLNSRIIINCFQQRTLRYLLFTRPGILIFLFTLVFYKFNKIKFNITLIYWSVRESFILYIFPNYFKVDNHYLICIKVGDFHNQFFLNINSIKFLTNENSLIWFRFY